MLYFYITVITFLLLHLLVFIIKIRFDSLFVLIIILILIEIIIKCHNFTHGGVETSYLHQYKFYIKTVSMLIE